MRTTNTRHTIWLPTLHRLAASLIAVTVPLVLCSSLLAENEQAENPMPRESIEQSEQDTEPEEMSSPLKGNRRKAALAELTKLSQVFASLSSHNVQGKEWVIVSVGPADQNDRRAGWLLSDDSRSMTILSATGSTWRIRKPRPDETRPPSSAPLSLDDAIVEKNQEPSKEPDSVADAPISSESDGLVAWKIEAGDYVETCRKIQVDGLPVKDPFLGELPDVYRFMHERFNAEREVRDIGWHAHWASQLQESELALLLYSAAKQKARDYAKKYPAAQAESLSQFVANDIVSSDRIGAISGAHKGAPRPELLKTWRGILESPGHDFHQEAAQMVTDYEKLIDQDERWAARTVSAVEDMTIEEQVEYWMYQLRDTDVGQHSDPGTCNVLGHWQISEFLSRKQSKDRAGNAATELKALGIAALPQIIAHLDDTRPTRCRGHWRSFAPESYYLLRYGDCCQQIFEAITAHSIYSADYTNGYPIKDGQGKVCKQKAQAWWKNFQEKGERQVLIEQTEVGDWDSVISCLRLIDKYPDSAAEAISNGARNAPSDRHRVDLLKLLSRVEDPRVAELMLPELESTSAAVRVFVADELIDRGHPRGFTALLEEWQKLQVLDEGWADDDDQGSAERLIGRLVDSARVEACETMEQGYRNVSPRLRWFLLESTNQLIRRSNDPDRNESISKEIEDAIDRLLVRALSDTECPGRNCRIEEGGKSIEGLPVGALAAWILANRWQTPSAFDPEADYRVRRRQKIELANVWRKKQGLVLLPLPDSLMIEPADAAVTGPLLTAVDRSQDVAVEVAQLEALGLSALPAVNAKLTAMPAEHDRRPQLEALAARLRCIVQEVTFTDDSLEPTPELREMFEVWKDQRVTATKFVSTVLAGYYEIPVAAYGLHVALEHPGDTTGTTMVVSLVRRRDHAYRGKGRNWKTYERVELAGRELRDTTRGHFRAFLPTDLPEFTETLQAVLDAPPDESFSIHFGVTTDRKVTGKADKE